MNFLLQKLESHIDEGALIEGESLLEAGAANGLFELEKHLWLATVDGHEVELKVSPSKVLGGTCECERFAEEGMCEHLAALMMAVRRKQQAHKQKREQEKKESQGPRKLTTGIVLDNVNLEELAEFVRDYAKANRNFAIALKARFASIVTEIGGNEKYMQLLESTIKAVRKLDRSISMRGRRLKNSASSSWRPSIRVQGSLQTRKDFDILLSKGIPFELTGMPSVKKAVVFSWPSTRKYCRTQPCRTK